MKEFIDFVKKLWNNKRTRALAILLVYFIFFIFVFALINSSSSIPPVIDVSPLEEMKEKDIYQIEFLGSHNFVVVDNMITYNGGVYNVEERPSELSIYDISIFNTNNIYDLINSAVLESTNHVEKTNTYLIDAEKFENIIYNNQMVSDSNIRITINEEDINYIYIDLKEYYGYEVKIDLRS